MKRRVVIVEPRKHDKLAYVVDNFHRRMDPSYDLYVFHGKTAREFARECTRAVVGRKGSCSS